MTAPDWRATYARERAKRVARIRAEHLLAGGQGVSSDVREWDAWRTRLGYSGVRP